jgi:hypothetical protein
MVGSFLIAITNLAVSFAAQALHVPKAVLGRPPSNKNEPGLTRAKRARQKPFVRSLADRTFFQRRFFLIAHVTFPQSQ